MQVSVASRRDGAAVVLMVSGDIDVTSAPALDGAIRRAVTTTGLELVQVDLSEVDFLDSSGISSLKALHNSRTSWRSSAVAGRITDSGTVRAGSAP